MTDIKVPEAASEPVEQQSLHHFLVSGDVIYVKDGSKEFSRKMNAVMTTAITAVNSHQISQAQRALQMRLYSLPGIDPEKVKVIDVFLYGISYLGQMTQSEFNPPLPDNFLGVAEMTDEVQVN